MADITVLRQNAIVRNATTGATPPHGSVKTGELPLVQVKQAPGGPQVQEGQQKPVTILPPNNAESAVKTGGLPMVKVKMSDGKPKPDDGVADEKVVIRDSKHGAVSMGGLPMVHVKMTDGKPQIQTLPNVQGGPPQIPSAPPALSAPRAASQPARQGYVARGPLPSTSQVRVARVAAPQQPTTAAPQQPQVALPPIPEMASDELLFCRHLAEKYLSDVRAATTLAEASSTEAPGEIVQLAPTELAMIRIAETMILKIDDILVATAVHAEAAAIAAATPPPQAVPTIAMTASGSIASVPSVSAVASQSIAPTPSVAYVAGRVGAGPFVAAGARAQRNASMAPRRVSRPAAPLPMVQVKMDGQRAFVQNRAEIEEAALAAAEAASPAPIAGTPDDSGSAQG